MRKHLALSAGTAAVALLVSVVMTPSPARSQEPAPQAKGKGGGKGGGRAAPPPGPVGPTPRMVVHCRTIPDIQLAMSAARSAGLALSVRGGGHDWAGRALCDGLVLDLSGMRDVQVSPTGAARASREVPAPSMSSRRPIRLASRP